MYQPSSLGRLFWHRVDLTDPPLVHRGKTSEVDWPYRYARPLIFRNGLVIGWWRDHAELDISTHLAGALRLGDAMDIDDDDDLITSDTRATEGAPGRRLELSPWQPTLWWQIGAATHPRPRGAMIL
jgi:hypothetical protein